MSSLTSAACACCVVKGPVHALRRGIWKVDRSLWCRSIDSIRESASVSIVVGIGGMFEGGRYIVQIQIQRALGFCRIVPALRACGSGCAPPPPWHGHGQKASKRQCLNAALPSFVCMYSQHSHLAAVRKVVVFLSNKSFEYSLRSSDSGPLQYPLTGPWKSSFGK